MWCDCAGLVDHDDGEVSFSDVVYFMMITITTAEYGEIIRSSPGWTHRRARSDADADRRLAHIFLGTDYQLVIRRVADLDTALVGGMRVLAPRGGWVRRWPC